MPSGTSTTKNTTQEVRVRKQQPFTVSNYGSGVKAILPLSRGMILRELYLNLKCAITMSSGGANVNSAVQPGDAWGVVKRIDIVANASDVIRSFSGNQLWWLNRMWYGLNPGLTTTLGDGASATVTVDSTLIVPFWSPRSVKPLDTALDTRTLSDLRIEVTWGTFTDVSSAATAFTANNSPSLNISSLESFGIDGPFKLKRIFQIISTPSASNPQLRIDIPVGPQYRGFLINATTTAVPAVDTPGLITNFKIISGSTVFFDMAETMLRDISLLRYDIPFNQIRPSAAGIAYRSQAMNSNSANEFGWYIIDLCSDGYLSEAIDTYGLSEFYLELNTSAAGTYTILPIQIVPVRT